MYQRYLRYRFASCLSCLLGRSTPDWHPQLSLHKPYLDRFCQRLHMEPWRRETCLRPFSLELFGWPCGVCREHFGPVACFGATGTRFPECLKNNPEFSNISTQQSILMRVTSSHSLDAFCFGSYWSLQPVGAVDVLWLRLKGSQASQALRIWDYTDCAGVLFSCGNNVFSHEHSNKLSKDSNRIVIINKDHDDRGVALWHVFCAVNLLSKSNYESNLLKPEVWIVWSQSFHLQSLHLQCPPQDCGLHFMSELESSRLCRHLESLILI